MCKAMRLAVAALVVGLAAHAAAPSPEEIARWIEQLGHDDAAVRKEAVRKLWEAGKAAEPALQAASRSRDADVALRAADVLSKFKRGIYPDTPPAVVKLIDQFDAAGGTPLRQKALSDLLDQGHAGTRAAAWLVKKATGEPERTQLAAHLGKETTRVAGALVVRGKIDEAKELIEAASGSGAADVYRHQAAFLVLRGLADERIKALEAAEKGDPQASAALAYLHRARGNLAAARQAAERAGLPNDTVRAFAEEQGDWAYLAKSAPEVKVPPTPRTVALEALYHRLSGDDKKADELAERVGKMPNADMKALCFTGRLQAGVDQLTKQEKFADAFDLLAIQLRYADAFKIAEKAELRNPEEAFLLACRRARQLIVLGDKDAARKVLSDGADALPDVKTDPRLTSAIRAVYQSGEPALALELATKLLDKSGAANNPQFLTGGLFPTTQTGAAGMWWTFMRQRWPDEKPADTLKRLWAMLEKKESPKEIGDLFDAAARAVEGADEAAREGRWHLLAQTAERLDDKARVRSCLEKAAAVRESAAVARLLGDWLASQKEWGEASRWYGKAFEKDRTRAAPLYLHGWAMMQAGKEKEGNAIVEQAILLPLADDANRFELAQALDKLGLREEANRQAELITRTGQFRTLYTSNAHSQLISRPAKPLTPAALAAHYEQIVLTSLQRNSNFIDPLGNFRVPYLMHQNRGKAFAVAGKIDEARRELAVCRSFAAAEIEPALEIVRALDKAGKKEEADKLFKETLEAVDARCKEYAKSAGDHNRFAWLTARTGRDLDRGLEHARKAVELAPKAHGYLDTLAEVHFQRGDKTEAIRCMKQCVELDPRNEYYPRQIKRFEAGDPKAELPR